jgi:hypothetical protein
MDLSKTGVVSNVETNQLFITVEVELSEITVAFVQPKLTKILMTEI